MKKTSYLFGIIAISTIYSSANAADLMPYANTVTANMIAGIQHTISNRALMGTPRFDRTFQPKPNRPMHDSPDRYGTMRYYGEFGDDTGILPIIGRSGGEEETEPTRVGFDFTHSTDDVKFKNLDTIDSKTNIARISVAPQMGPTDLEIFGGYAGHHSRNGSLDIDGDGAFLGIAAHTDLDGLGVGIVVNAGVMANTTNSATFTRDFENIWANVAVGAKYDIELAPSVLVRPGITAGYMWVGAQNYVAQNGNNIDIKNFGVLELTPAMDVDFRLADGWHIGANAAYIINFAAGGETSVDYVRWPNLDPRDYIEYALSFGQTTDRLDLSLNFGRHDIGRTGWHGGFRVNYVF